MKIPPGGLFGNGISSTVEGAEDILSLRAGKICAVSGTAHTVTQQRDNVTVPKCKSEFPHYDESAH